MSERRTAYTEARLAEARGLIQDLLDKQKSWSSRELSRAYREAQRDTARANQQKAPPFSALDRRVVENYVLSTMTDTEEALRSVVPSLERVFIGARQELITSQQLQSQIAAGLVVGLTPDELTQGLRRALRTGATEQLKGKISDELRGRLVDAAEGKFITILCRDGKYRSFQLSHYADMVVRTSRAFSSVEGALQSAVGFNLDLVQVSVHVGACPICIPQQGMVYSLSGATSGFPRLTPENRPPYHPWCPHRLLPTSAETLGVEGSLESLKRFSNDPDRVVTSTSEYLEVAAGTSRGVAREAALAGAPV